MSLELHEFQNHRENTEEAGLAESPACGSATSAFQLLDPPLSEQTPEGVGERNCSRAPCVARSLVTGLPTGSQWLGCSDQDDQILAYVVIACLN